jgi:hypothetical protein
MGATAELFTLKAEVYAFLAGFTIGEIWKNHGLP